MKRSFLKTLLSGLIGMILVNCCPAVRGENVSLYNFKIPKVSNFKTFSKSIYSYNPVKELTKEENDALKSIKKEFKAQKIDLIEIENGKRLYRLLYSGNKVLLVDEQWSEFASPYPTSKWPSNTIEVIKIEGDSDYYYMVNHEEMDFLSDPPKRKGISKTVLMGPSGNYLDGNSTAALCEELNGVKYIHSIGKSFVDNNITYRLNVKDGSLYCNSDKPIKYAPSVTAGAEENVTINNVTISVPQLAHPAYFVTTYNLVNESDYKSVTPMFSSIMLGNTGYILTGVVPEKTFEESTTVLYDGDAHEGKQMSFKGDYEGISALGLKTTDGKVLIKDARELSLSNPDNVAYFVSWDDGYYFKGAVSLEDTTVQIPARFANAAIVRDNNGRYKRLVSSRPFENMVEYDESLSDYTYEPSSEIERQFVMKNYLSALNEKNYNDKEFNALSARDMQIKLVSYLMLGNEALSKARLLEAQYLSGVEPEDINKEYGENWYPEWMLGVVKDSDVKKIKERYLSLVAPDIMMDAEVLMADVDNLTMEINEFISRDMPKAREVYANIKLQEKIEREEIERQMKIAAEKAAWQKQQEQAAYAQALLAGFARILGGIVNSASVPSSPKINGGSYSKSTVVNGSIGGGSVSGSQSNNDNTDHKIWMNNQRITLQQKLDKAYKQLEHATDSYNKNPSNTTKNLMESAKRYYEEIQRELRELK